MKGQTKYCKKNTAIADHEHQEVPVRDHDDCQHRNFERPKTGQNDKRQYAEQEQTGKSGANPFCRADVEIVGQPLPRNHQTRPGNGPHEDIGVDDIADGPHFQMFAEQVGQ